MRPVKSTSTAVNGGGGTKKSWLLTAVPGWVDTEIFPERLPVGTLAVIDVGVELATLARVGVIRLNLTMLLASTVSKFVPVIVTDVPAVPVVGVNPVIVGAPVEVVTMKAAALVADPVGVVRPIGPVVAPEGTLVVIWVTVAEATVAATPLKVTVFWLAVVENPVPKIVTDVPTGLLLGVNSTIETWEES
jgi:hypothetical protein